MGFYSPYIIIAKILLSYREKRGCARLAIPRISSLDFHHEALVGLFTHTFHPTLQHLFCDLIFPDSEPVSRLLRESSSISYTRISSASRQSGLLAILRFVYNANIYLTKIQVLYSNNPLFFHRYVFWTILHNDVCHLLLSGIAPFN